MNIDEEKQQRLEDILKELSCYALKKDKCEEVYNEFKSIYKDNFRHKYSKLFCLLVELEDSEKIGQLAENLEELCQYLEDIASASEEQEVHLLHRQLFKLTDHLILEIGRYDFTKKSESQIQYLSDKAKKLQEQFGSINKQLNKTSRQLIKAKRNLSSVQTQTVAVLGVFAAIVTTFAGGLSYLNGTLCNLSATPIMKVICVASLCGIVLSNTVYILLSAIGIITDHPIQYKPRRRRKQEPAWLVWIKTQPPILWLNILLLASMAISLYFSS